jgi:LemA protein
MLVLIVLVAFVIGLPLLIFAVMYNSLVGKRNQVDNVFATVDALLKKRYDLIPNLVATVKQYMQHESKTLTDISALRARATSGGLSSDEAVDVNNRMSQALRGLMVQVEAYPNLRASENFQQLQASLNEIEEQLSAARRAFNAAVTDLNNAVEMFPTNIIAGMAGFKRRTLFEIPEEERQNVSVKELFKG